MSARAMPKRRTKAADRVHQVTVSYAADADRLLLRISTAGKNEFRLWLTRRFTKSLWGLLMGPLEREPGVAGGQAAPGAKDAIMAMCHQEAVLSADFSKKHQPGVPATPGGGEPLAVSAQLTPAGPDQNRLAITTDVGVDINLNLDRQLLHALCHMLVQATTQAEWGLDLAIGEAGQVVAGDRAKVH